MLLIKGCETWRPEPAGQQDILIGGGTFLAVADTITAPGGCAVEEINATGLIAVPGLIDNHVHIAGAGGEGGPASRTPELRLSQLITGGITTVVGCLGTDGLTRTVASVLMKVKALRAEGVSAWMMTGAYQIPTPTLLGDVGKDIAMIEEVIGVGEIAIADHRSSGPTVDQLIQLTGHARVGGMLGDKAGIINFHMGDAKDPFRILYEIVEQSELKPTQFLPTHCNRNHHIFEDAKLYGKSGYVDLTTSSYPYFPEYEIKPSEAVPRLIEAGVPPAHITLSSDGCGSLPDFDEAGNLVRLETGQPKSVFDEVRDLIQDGNVPMEQALALATSNPARILKLTRKGWISPGMDADMVLLDSQYNIVHVIANGRLMMKDAQLVKRGTFEP